MTRFKAAAVGTLAIVLSAAPLSALANGNGRHYSHGHYYWNPLYPIVGLAAAVVGTAAAIVTLPFQVLGAAAQAPYYAPRQSYAPPQGYGAPGYAAPQAYYRGPAVSYAPQTGSYYYGAPAPYYPPRSAGYGGYRAPDGYAANGGYYRPNGGPSGAPNDAPYGGSYAPRPTPYGPPNGDYTPYQDPRYERPNDYNSNTR